jgi:putative colanic acid biosynthesis UDP-glucose lipid carrier transferase
MWGVIVGDFVLLNVILYVFSKLDVRMAQLSWERMRMFVLISNFALVISEVYFHTTIHQRLVSAGDVVRNVTMLTITQALVAYVFMRHLLYMITSGWLLFQIGTAFFVLLLITRLIERSVIKRMRRLGRNTRTVTFLGNDPELRSVYEQLVNDPTAGYRMLGYYADEKIEDGRIEWLGTASGLVKDIENGNDVEFGDELYVCLSRKDSHVIRLLSGQCDKQVTKFYYIPLSVESIGLNLKREYVSDIEVYTTYESPLANPMNKFLKRSMDILLSTLFLIPTAIIFPFVWLVIKIQSPGPIFFKQERTGLDGKNFWCYKFRSMHVNKDADKLQATKDDPRKYPFGNFMRKANIDELPQFWNVLMGDMSIVGPRPHMLAHTEMYSQLIDKYMVRHFVKPGITGWAQVTGFRGETKELWQMEGRVKRDIWYMENWSIWLDIRIIWLTIKTIFVHDKNAY